MELIDKKPGAVYNNDPRIIFVKMIKRVAYYNKGHFMERICSMRGKFNTILEEETAAAKYHILSILSCNTEDCFDPQGKLSFKGKQKYWLELDDLLERFDKKKIDLLPRIDLHVRQNNRDEHKNNEKDKGKDRKHDQGERKQRY